MSKNKFPWGEGREWKKRTEMIASLIPAHSSVLDLGCGFCHLKKYLRKECRYIGVDKDTWVDEIVTCEFNKNEFPNVGIFDFIVCQGILEYINEPQEFLKQIRKYGQTLILTYKLYTTTDIENRNIYSFREIVEMLTEANWEIVEHQKVDNGQNLYICKKS